jgi:hypothetical protein
MFCLHRRFGGIEESLLLCFHTLGLGHFFKDGSGDKWSLDPSPAVECLRIFDGMIVLELIAAET